MTQDHPKLKNHPVVSHEEWLAERTALLVKEKAFSRLREDLAQQRRDLPWEKVEKEYIFEGPNGKESLADLFGNKSQLIVYHFMFPPQDDEGCPNCSFWADSFNGSSIHLPQHDISFVAISRAPFSKIKAFEQRMGWSFKWLSSFESDFNYDFHVSFPLDAKISYYNYVHVENLDTSLGEREGISVFYRDESGTVYHTYSCFARGIDMMNATYQYIDLTPVGRDEAVKGNQYWVRHHDKYED